MAPITTRSEAEAPRPAPRPDYPTPLLRLRFEDIAAPASRIFLQSLDASRVLSNAKNTVLSILYPRVFTPAEEAHDAEDTSIRTAGGDYFQSDVSTQTEASASPGSVGNHPSNPTPWPGTRSVTLAVEPATQGVAQTSGIALDADHKRIGLANSYVESLELDEKGIGKELEGVIVHEMVHCWQWDGKGECNGGLVEGVADWVRLKAGLAPPHWKARHGKDDNWDSGYAITAYFLEWLETTFGKGAVVRINAALREKYEEEKLWKRLFGTGVDELWIEYCAGPGRFVEEKERKDDRIETSEEDAQEAKSLDAESGAIDTQNDLILTQAEDTEQQTLDGRGTSVSVKS